MILARSASAIVLGVLGALASIASAACGPGPTSDPKAATAKALPGPECPASPGAPNPDPALMATVAGKTVTKMCVFGLDGESRTRAQKALVSQEGQPLDIQGVRDDIGALLKLGMIDDVVVSAMPGDGGVILLYQVKERPRIQEVVFDGAHLFEKEGLTEKVALAKERPLVRAEVSDLVAAMREEYDRRGYRSAKIDAKIEPVGPHLVRLRFVVVEGPKWTIGKVVFKGASKISEADLKKAAELEPGEAYDAEKMEHAAALLGALLLDRGMITSRVERTDGTPDAEGKADVTFTIVEGDVYKIHELKLGKLASADEKNLLGKLKSKPKQVFSRANLLDDVKTLKDAFEARGQKVDVVPKTEVDPQKKTVDVTLDVEAVP